MYGPGGPQPLLPDAQPASPALKLGRVDLTSSSEQRFVEITNPLKYAVDVSNWKLSGAVTATIKPGTHTLEISQHLWPLYTQNNAVLHEMECLLLSHTKGIRDTACLSKCLAN